MSTDLTLGEKCALLRRLTCSEPSYALVPPAVYLDPAIAGAVPLFCLLESTRIPLTVQHVCALLSWSQSKAYRLAQALEAAGWIERGRGGWVLVEPGSEPSGFVYLAELWPSGVLKVGYSLNPVRRVRAISCLQLTDSASLIAFAPGTKSDESAIHAAAVHHLVHGREWFEPQQEVVDLFASWAESTGSCAHVSGLRGPVWPGGAE